MRAGAYDLHHEATRPGPLVARRASRAGTAAARDQRAPFGERADRTLDFGARSSARARPCASWLSKCSAVLESEVAVCVSGESGTGKELVARAIHAGGQRRRGPFVAINCAGIPESLQESEAIRTRARRVQRRDPDAAGLLRASQRRHVALGRDRRDELADAGQPAPHAAREDHPARGRLGGDPDRRAHGVRHAPRSARRSRGPGRFREDLYFRLVVYPIHLPALRERVEDIPLLVGHFLRTLTSDVGRQVHRISPEVLEAMARHRWPGNVRELQNVVHRQLTGLSRRRNQSGGFTARHPRARLALARPVRGAEARRERERPRRKRDLTAARARTARHSTRAPRHAGERRQRPRSCSASVAPRSTAALPRWTSRGTSHEFGRNERAPALPATGDAARACLGGASRQIGRRASSSGRPCSCASRTVSATIPRIRCSSPLPRSDTIYAHR